MTSGAWRARATRPALLAGAVCLVAGSVGLWTGTARAAMTFTAAGSAFGVQASQSGSAFPLGASGEGSSPVAQATVDSLGTSRGFASSPYPGDFVTGNYGLVAGLTNQPVPPYPFMVASDAATDPEPAPLAGPGYSLSSKSSPDATKAAANQGASSSGNQGGYAEAAASAARHDDGAVDVEATSLSSGFGAGGVLSFGTVTTVARAKVDTGGTMTTSSDLQVTGATINGQSVGFANGQFVLPGTAQPLPDNPFGSVLAQAGVTVTYVGAEKLPNGVESPGIRVTVTQHAADGTPAAGDYTTTYVLGRSIATIDHEGAPEAAGPAAAGGIDGAPAGPPASPADGTGTGTSTASGDIAATGSLSSPSSPAGSAGTSSSPADVAAPATAAPGSPAGAGRAAPGAGTRSTGPLALAAGSRQGDAGTIYLVLVLAGVLLIASTGVVRYIGVRSPWTS